MNTPNDTRTTRPQFWLRAIELRKHAMTKQYRRTLGDSAREGISDDDYATTMATLEQMARNLGWTEENQAEHDERRRHFGPGPRGHRGGPRGFGHRFGHATHDEHDGEHPFPTPRTEA